MISNGVLFSRGIGILTINMWSMRVMMPFLFFILHNITRYITKHRHWRSPSDHRTIMSELTATRWLSSELARYIFPTVRQTTNSTNWRSTDWTKPLALHRRCACRCSAVSAHSTVIGSKWPSTLSDVKIIVHILPGVLTVKWKRRPGPQLPQQLQHNTYTRYKLLACAAFARQT